MRLTLQKVPKHVLLIGFEPFGGEKVNPGELVARGFEGRLISGRLVTARVLPVETRNIRERLERAIGEESPDIVICVGQAGGRTAIALERMAVNLLDFDVPDNVGVMRKSDPILRGGPDARLSPLPFAEIVDAWTENGIPGYVSNAAGTFICNQALYEVLSIAEDASPPIVAGLVHLPYLPSQAALLGAEKTPSMAFEMMKRAMEVLLETLIAWIEQRVPERGTGRTGKSETQMWIPRGVKEVER